ncbi:MAG: molybdopterin-synthase adenylyltransferase MoeB [Propionivibrio sp.]|jgi:adenylyltransferase/sulfurtransferase|nr:molybdopterin-synthase adenylyltransferase MoeB [Propionivibrio sp.]MBP6709791.1 molybdopterin-synthase adenylyltransferase MoeB [Propionivibrio sp.]MBP7523201.1 molybdopterin-synthase adenylyltransferase MoeB [Propionivibrio sp.]
MNDEQLLRFSRHILLDEIGIEGQSKIIASHALVIGAGGLGSPAALYLASAGVGRITLADGDTVDLTNLQRQILHTQDRIGMLKARSGQMALAQINPEVAVEPITERLAGEQLEALIANVDIVLDCCDNFATRYAVNRACVKHGTPLVSGAAIRFSGQLSVFDCRRADTPCYHCLFPEGEEVEETRCAVMGIFAPLTGVIGSMQAAEALKIISGAGQPAIGRLLLLDGLTMEWRSVRYGKDPKCAVCGD